MSWDEPWAHRPALGIRPENIGLLHTNTDANLFGLYPFLLLKLDYRLQTALACAGRQSRSPRTNPVRLSTPTLFTPHHRNSTLRARCLPRR